MMNFTIPNGTKINDDWEAPPSSIERLYIEKDFDFADWDYSYRFYELPNLKEYVVLNESGSFFTYQGCLYKRYSKPATEVIYEICGDIPEYINSGSILISCPRCNPYKDIILPQDCISIAACAFVQCKLNSITLPNSLVVSTYAAFYQVKVNTIYVPNKHIIFSGQHNDVDENVAILCNDPFSPELDFEMETFWRCVFNEEVWDMNKDLFPMLPPEYYLYEDDRD